MLRRLRWCRPYSLFQGSTHCYNPYLHAAHLDLDTSTSFFSVYDGHGGFGSALNMETLVATTERRDTPLETRNAISGTYLASQRSASSAALLVGDPTAMHNCEIFVLEDTVGSTVA